MTEKWCKIQGKLDLNRVSGKFELSEFELSGFYCTGEPAQGLMTKTITLHLHDAFLYISLLSLHDFHLKLHIFKFYGGLEHKTTTFFFLFLNLDSIFAVPDKFLNGQKLAQTDPPFVYTKPAEPCKFLNSKSKCNL